MYEYCKKSITRKIEKGTLTPVLKQDFKTKLGVFYWSDEISEDEYNELLDLLGPTDSEDAEDLLA